MKIRVEISSFFFAFIMAAIPAVAQQTIIVPDLSTINTPQCSAVNRKAQISGDAVYMDAREGDGLLIFKNILFSNGRIELDIKGKNKPQQSFVGLAFHGMNDSTFDAVYFRPFNFKDPGRDTHSVQYISMPQHDWYELREKHPGMYENNLTVVPDPDEWFHVSIRISYPDVKVFVNNSLESSLSIAQISRQSYGWIGFWVGNGSDGYFKNLKIYPDQ
jgi:hypothetical protein